MKFENWLNNREKNNYDMKSISSKNFSLYVKNIDADLYEDLQNEALSKYAAPILMGLGSMLGGSDAKAAPQDVPAKVQKAPRITHKLEDGVLTVNIPAKNSSLNAVKDVSDLIRAFDARMPKPYGIPNRIFDLDDPTKPIYAPDLARKINSNQGKDLTLRLKFSNVGAGVGKEDQKKPEEKKDNKVEHHKWTNKDLEILSRSLNRQLADKNIKIDVFNPKNNFKFYKPKDFIEMDYGQQYKSVIDRASKAQKAEPTPEGIDVARIENDIPVLFIDPMVFGSNSDGFCNQITIGGKKLQYCVVKRNLPEEKIILTLKHELRHTMQNPIDGDNILFADKIQDNKQEKYMFDKDEIAVRLGKMKSQFSKFTDKDPSNFDEVWRHFKNNSERYDYDVRQLNYNINILDRIKLRTGEDLHKQFKDYMKDTWRKVVKTDKDQSDFIAK